MTFDKDDWRLGYHQQLIHADDSHFMEITNYIWKGSGTPPNTSDLSRDVYIVWEINSA